MIPTSVGHLSGSNNANEFYDYSSSGIVIPTIHLLKTVTVSSGNGTESSPYVIG